MLNKILFWVLTRLYRIPASYTNPINWRVAHPSESISMVLKCRPLIYQLPLEYRAKIPMSRVAFGFGNVMFMVRGKVYLAPNFLHDEYGLPSDIDLFSGDRTEKSQAYTIAAYNRYTITATLLKNYMEINPHIVVKKFPTRLLRLLLKRNVPIAQQAIMNANALKELESKMSVSQAIQADLSEGQKNFMPPAATFEDDDLSQVLSGTAKK